LLLVLVAACAVGQFVIGLWLAMIKAQIGKPIDEVAADDPLRIQFDNLHEWSVWILFAGMIAALLAFFIVTNRKFDKAKPASPLGDFDFQKEFKI
jgi:phosphotransferase system  glucose/maltose/N-acetylglucosamine-specific IIC component